ncbi:MAG: T9SS type A sorting domain-containing protein [Chryseobacterium sp.]|jgi:pimeloyl-ACP methyl ester carboxylesterase|uniref:T9SS type A sorting domain-containing protein n=1 Tax=Chryseobacterium sp. TaxID=1871047 RepID=UPI0028203555|nr:T9SS type A sorting domain-containing protein [Chryseobacterium sp.]MDR2234835.1 T9SS type A sorting domain-containing protein [Chryseobacterium sp.]
MKQKLLLLLLSFFTLGMYAQTEENMEGFSRKMAEPFMALERDRIPHGILLDYAWGLTDIEQYNSEKPLEMDVHIYGSVYKELFSGVIHENGLRNLPTMPEMAAKWVTYRKEYNNEESVVPTLVLSGLYAKFSKFAMNAYDENKILVENQQFKDVYRNGVWQNPYQEDEIFALTAPINQMNSLKFNVVLPKELLLGNGTEEIQTITADFGGGNPQQILRLNEPVTVNYPTEGKYNWAFSVTLTSGRIKRIKFPIDIIRGEIGGLFGDLNNIKINNGKHSATLRIDYINDNDKRITRPLIVAEGFDLSSALTPEKVGGDLSLSNFKTSLSNSPELQNILSNSQKYDIIYVDWRNGIGDIRQNAETLKKIIKYVNGQKAANGSTAPNVLLGQSMGGLVSKYALVKLEQENYNHQVSLFIAHDSPLDGANIPVGAQYMLRHANELYSSNPFLHALGDHVVPFVLDIIGLFNQNFITDFGGSDVLTIVDCPAALQMTKNYIAPNWQYNTSYHQSWQNEFDALGYPTQSRNVAISNGNMCGMNQGYNAGDNLFKYQKETASLNELNSTLINLSMTFWGATTNNLGLVLFSTIPLPSQIRADFQIKTIPETTNSDREVYRGILKYDKKFRVKWLGINWTITYDVTNKKGYIGNTVLPTENLAGGYYNADVGLVSQYIVNSKFNFIPVPSALGIKRTNGNLTLQDYKRSYSSSNLQGTGLTSPFNEFIAESASNFKHISFSEKTGNFLGNELSQLLTNGTNYSNTNCSAFCGDMIIAGASRVCSGANQTYSIPAINVPGTTITWTAGSGLQIVSGQGTSSITVKVNPNSTYTGTSLINVIIDSGGTCGKRSVIRAVTVGGPAKPAELYGPATINVIPMPNGNPPISPILTYEVDPVQDATYYEWQLPGNFQTVQSFSTNPANWELLASTANQNAISVKTNNTTGGVVKVRACNTCGCSAFKEMPVTIKYNNGGFGITPNPADHQIQLYLLDSNNRPEFRNNQTDVTIYDMNSQLRKRFQITSTGGSTSVAELETGIYKVQVDMQNGSYQVINLSISRR